MVSPLALLVGLLAVTLLLLLVLVFKPSITRAPGTQITARSTGSGISSIDPYPRTPATGSAPLLTG